MPNLQETISQVLSPTNATYINGVSVRREFSKAALEAIFQGMVERGGRGVNGNFVTEKEANDAGQIFVNRVKAHLDEGREHGSAKNGGAFNNEMITSATETVGIEILQYFDRPIIIPRATQDRIAVDLAATEIANYVKSINLALNGSSFAAKWLATYSVAAAKRNVVKIGSSDNVLTKFLEANALLNRGDMEHDIDVFDTETRIATFKMAYYPTLLTGGILTLGGANYGYDIARKGTLDAESAKVDLAEGYWGTVGGVPIHGLSDMSLKYAAWFCGMPEEEFYDGTAIHGVVSSSLANARGVSMVDQVETNPHPFGQGLVVKPFTKIGAKTWFPKGNVFLTGEDYDPIADLKTMFSGVASQITFKLKSKGSRYYAAAEISAISATAFTVKASALDDVSNDHVLAAYFKVVDAPITRVADFLKATATYKGAVTTIGSSETTTIADSKYVSVLVIADDGTCTLVNKQYIA